MDDEETAVIVWGSREQLLENFLICFHKAMTSAHKSSNYIEAGSVQAQPRVILEMLTFYSIFTSELSHGPTVLRCTGRYSLELGFLLTMVFTFMWRKPYSFHFISNFFKQKNYLFLPNFSSVLIFPFGILYCFFSPAPSMKQLLLDIFKLILPEKFSSFQFQISFSLISLLWSSTYSVTFFLTKAQHIFCLSSCLWFISPIPRSCINFTKVV